MSSKDKEVKVEKIQPVITVSDVKFTLPFEPRPGEYHLVKLDKNGKEIIGSDVSVPENLFKRTFQKLTIGANPSYLVKKNPK